MDKQSKLVPVLLLFTFNLLQFSTYVLKVPPLFVLVKVLTLMVFLGGFLRLVRGDKLSKFEGFTLKGFLTPDNAEKVARSLFKNFSCLLTHTKSVVLWDDPVKSLYSLFLLYLLTQVLKVVPSVLVVFFLVWGCFLYVYMNEYLQKNVFRHFEPYTKKVIDLMYKVYNSIPRLKDDKVL